MKTTAKIHFFFFFRKSFTPVVHCYKQAPIQQISAQHLDYLDSKKTFHNVNTQQRAAWVALMIFS